MKYFIIISLVLTLYSQTYSQCDTLLIHLKNGTTEKIALNELQKIIFVNATFIDDTHPVQPELKNFPNPFSGITTIAFENETPGTVEVNIYDITGNLVRTLTCGNCPAGNNQLIWDTKNQSGNTVPGGVYYFEILGNNNRTTKQMIKVK